MDANGYPTKIEIQELQKEGHTFHCAIRILVGDGECECDKSDVIPGPISQSMYKGFCFVCLAKESQPHADRCRNRK